MTTPSGPDRTPGAEASLLAFYALVPVAEEFDLAEEASAVRRDAHLESSQEPIDPQSRLTEGQVIGLLEHVLGAELIEEHPYGRRGRRGRRG